MSTPATTTSGPSQQRHPWRWVWAVVVILVIIAVVGACTSLPHGTDLKPDAAMTVATPSATPTPTPSVETCPAEFTQTEIDRTGNRNKADGLKDDKEALALLGHDAVSLKVAAALFGVEVPDENLVTEDGNCLSEAGKAVFYGVKGIATAKGTTVNNSTEVPSDWTNSGVFNEQVVFAEQPGIYGDRSATSWTWVGPDGKTYVVYVMHRCGNWPAPTPPSGHPTGPTDNPPPPEQPKPKDPAKDPGAQGNAPIGSGQNDDTGPGTYEPPTSVTQPPDQPRENPQPPKPEPPKPPKPKPTQDPEPPPPPEPPAPPTENPVDQCVVIPGVEDCK